MHFLIKSRAAAQRENFVKLPHVIISISTPGDPQARPKTNDATIAIRWLQFHDMDREPTGSAAEKVYGPIVLFDAGMAKEVINFMTLGRGLDLEAVVVHCDAGISRSSAIAAALAKKIDDDDGWIFRDYTPNMLVYRVMMEELQNVEW